MQRKRLSHDALDTLRQYHNGPLLGHLPVFLITIKSNCLFEEKKYRLMLCCILLLLDASFLKSQFVGKRQHMDNSFEISQHLVACEKWFSCSALKVNVKFNDMHEHLSHITSDSLLIRLLKLIEIFTQ